MRLHRLTLQAIGPYAGEHTIDFVELGRAGLFLLEGPTGAGKSTIIDAIVFGLYGELAGTGASKDRLHSHHAAPGVEPFVELVFETGSGVYRVRRTPAYQRPKQRGDGFTPQQASATLIRLTDPDASTGETMSTRAQEIGPEISRIVGLTREQFVQTIVLPQGEFAKFLASDGEERSRLLRSLFATEHYERLAAHLVEQRRQAHRDIEGAQEALGRAIARFSGAAELDSASPASAASAGSAASNTDAELCETAPADDRTADDQAALVVVLDAGSETLLTDAARIVLALRRIAESDAAAAAVSQGVLTQARSERDAAHTLQADLARRAQLLIERELLVVDDEPIEQLAARVDAALRADTVASALAGSDAAAGALEHALAALDGMSERVSTTITGLDDAELAARREAITVERAGMAALLGLESADAGREASLVALTDEVSAVEAQLTKLTETGRLRDARRAELSESAEVLDRANEELLGAAHLVEQAKARSVVLDRIERADAALDAANMSVVTAAAVAKEAVERETALRLRRIDGMSGELAAALRDGEPCSVCGSLTHPVPAPLEADHPDADAVDAAADARIAAEAAMQTAHRARDAAQAQRRQLVESFTAAADDPAAENVAADGGFDLRLAVAANADLISVASARHLAATSAAQTAVGEAAEARQLADDHLAAVLSRSALSTELATLVERTETARLVHERARADVTRKLGGRAASLAELDAVLAEELGQLVALLGARTAVVDCRRQDSVRAEELRQALVRAGLADRAAAVAAAMPEVERASAEARIDDHRRNVTANTLALESAPIAALTGTETPDVEGSTARLEAAEIAASSSTSAAAVSGRRAHNAENAAEALTAAVTADADAVREAAAMIRLADVVSASGSENTSRVTLGTYVLLRRFEDVVAAANARLESMSDGRYELVRSDVKEGPSRSQRVGLSLTVHDHRTNRRRDPKSLSGGETFYVSLCLALGLADVVTGEAGGVELGTLFVDEGFGSLDPETLDTVMAELGRLSDGGRVVGVVSHVEEMKQRIGERIEVRRLDDGSSTLLVRA